MLAIKRLSVNDESLNSEYSIFICLCLLHLSIIYAIVCISFNHRMEQNCCRMRKQIAVLASRCLPFFQVQPGDEQEAAGQPEVLEKRIGGHEACLPHR